MSQFAFGFGDPCLPTRVTVAPSGPQWVHEIKHDGIPADGPTDAQRYTDPVDASLWLL
jgi:hypothetical protein